MDPFRHGEVGEYVDAAPDDVSLGDIWLVSEPLSCSVVKIRDQLVFLPLTGASRTGQPLKALAGSFGGKTIELTGHASWRSCRFGEYRTTPVHLAGADAGNSLLGLGIQGTLPDGRRLEGVCIRHAGESATLLCPAPNAARKGRAAGP